MTTEEFIKNETERILSPFGVRIEIKKLPQKGECEIVIKSRKKSFKDFVVFPIFVNYLPCVVRQIIWRFWCERRLPLSCSDSSFPFNPEQIKILHHRYEKFVKKIIKI